MPCSCFRRFSRLRISACTDISSAAVQAEILNLLNRLKQEHGMTYLLVSHDADVIAHMFQAV
jgi:ABC-type dipeptide/oligopeptide/nickel transport system ATPase subunit